MTWILCAAILWLLHRDWQRQSWQATIAEAVTERLIRLERRNGLIDEDGFPAEEYEPSEEDEDYAGSVFPPEESGTGRARWVSDR